MTSFFGSIVKSFILPKPVPSYDTCDHPGKLLHIPKVDWRTRQENGEFTYGILLLDPTAKYMVIYAHTNAVDMGMMFDELSYFSKRASTSLLLFEYTGYGISPGDTTEVSMNEDMLSAYCYAVRYLYVPPSRIVLMGRSIGTGPAVQLSAALQDENEIPALLVLQSPFTSLKECANVITRSAGSIVSFLGYNWFRTIDVIARVRCPVIIQHGSLDDVVPFEHAKQIKKVMEEASPPGLLELYEEKTCKHNDLPIVNIARIVDKKLRGFGKERCLQIRCRFHLTVNPPIYEYLFCLNDKPITSCVALLHHWNKNLQLGSFVYKREKLYILLVASVALFAMRCAQVWQRYTWSLKRYYNGETNGDVLHCSKEDIVYRCLACWGSPLGIFLGVEGNPVFHKFFGVHVPMDTTLGGTDSSSFFMTYEDDITSLSIAELEFTPGLMKSVLAAMYTAPTFVEEDEGISVFLQKEVVTRIQTECERLVAFLVDNEWNNLLALLLNFNVSASTFLSNKAFQLYKEYNILPTEDIHGEHKARTKNKKEESIADLKEWLQPWVTSSNAQTLLGGEVPWDYYLFKARRCVQENHQLQAYSNWIEAKLVVDAWLVVAEIYYLFNTYSRRCLRPTFVTDQDNKDLLSAPREAGGFGGSLRYCDLETLLKRIGCVWERERMDDCWYDMARGCPASVLYDMRWVAQCLYEHLQGDIVDIPPHMLDIGLPGEGNGSILQRDSFDKKESSSSLPQKQNESKNPNENMEAHSEPQRSHSASGSRLSLPVNGRYISPTVSSLRRSRPEIEPLRRKSAMESSTTPRGRKPSPTIRTTEDVFRRLIEDANNRRKRASSPPSPPLSSTETKEVCHSVGRPFSSTSAVRCASATGRNWNKPTKSYVAKLAPEPPSVDRLEAATPTPHVERRAPRGLSAYVPSGYVEAVARLRSFAVTRNHEKFVDSLRRQSSAPTTREITEGQPPILRLPVPNGAEGKTIVDVRLATPVPPHCFVVSRNVPYDDASRVHLQNVLRERRFRLRKHIRNAGQRIAFMERSFCRRVRRDFDAWAYNINWPRRKALLPLLGYVSLTVEDIKFAYNAWCLLRLAMFFGAEYPKVLSPLLNTTPSMDIMYGGNRLFYMYAEVEGKLSRRKTKVALTPCHSHARPLQNFSWKNIVHNNDRMCVEGEEEEENEGFEIVLGMENGLSENIIEQCDHCLYIPQYGSIGSLSMLSAMAIAVHSAASAQYVEDMEERNGLFSLTLRGHMPLSHGDVTMKEGRSLPHEKDLLSLSNDEITKILELRRMSYSMQLSILVYNEYGDRNIGAIMRNANAFNCEQMIVLYRKKFSRRGAVGTHHLLKTSFYENLHDAGCQACLEGYVIWLLYQYYPYLKIYEDHNEDENVTFIRYPNPIFQQWLQSGHSLNIDHPMIKACGRHLIGTEVYLDSFESVRLAVQDARKDGYRGIMLVVPEEGASLHPDLVNSAQRIVYIVHPNHLAREVQRGLNGALSSAIALERLRTVIDNL